MPKGARLGNSRTGTGVQILRSRTPSSFTAVLWLLSGARDLCGSGPCEYFGPEVTVKLLNRQECRKQRPALRAAAAPEESPGRGRVEAGRGGARPETNAPTSQEGSPPDRRASKFNAIVKCGVRDRGKTWHWSQVALRGHLRRAREQEADCRQRNEQGGPRGSKPAALLESRLLGLV